MFIYIYIVNLLVRMVNKKLDAAERLKCLLCISALNFELTGDMTYELRKKPNQFNPLNTELNPICQ